MKIKNNLDEGKKEENKMIAGDDAKTAGDDEDDKDKSSKGT